MKGKFNLVIGLIGILTVVYYLYNCPTIDCDERILGFMVSGIIYLLFWGVLSIMLLFNVYKENTTKE